MSEKKVTIITIVYIVVILLLGGAGVYFLQIQKLTEKKKLVADQTVLEAAMTKKVRELVSLRTEITNLPEKEAAVAKVIPTLPSGRWDAHIDNFHARGLASQVSIVSIKEGRITGRKPAAGGGGKGVTADETYFDLSVKGGFNDLCRFIHMLEMDTPLVVVENFAIKGGKMGPTGELPPKELKILLKAYGFKKDDTAPKKAEVKASTPAVGKSR